MEMEVEVEKRKSKRVKKEEEESERVKKRSKGEEEDNGSDGIPTEEEVEEFFAILRRMRVAVKYFDHKGSGGREWREKLETTDLALLRDGDIAAAHHNDIPHQKDASQVVINQQAFDLNAVAPEAAEGGASYT
ncbi:hypothetical protein VNO78_32384 [Psophocarpus tetragonolobus]|uniref:Uncharacterized protein n=1 Tax=Psophocarpus tetragonolobus TaxID=3891 RepID=A0AAN9NWB7_PSOTE